MQQVGLVFGGLFFSKLSTNKTNHRFLAYKASKTIFSQYVINQGKSVAMTPMNLFSNSATWPYNCVSDLI